MAATPVPAPPARVDGSGSDQLPARRRRRGAQRIAALVDLARAGDAEAFGQLYDHYSPAVYRFIYYRVSSQALAEDLTSETFFRALRSMASFQWQGKDFGAWLTTIARNLVVDHYKAGRTRLETTTDDFSDRTEVTAGPEDEVLAGLTNEVLRDAMQQASRRAAGVPGAALPQRQLDRRDRQGARPLRGRDQAAPAPGGPQPGQAAARGRPMSDPYAGADVDRNQYGPIASFPQRRPVRGGGSLSRSQPTACRKQTDDR